MKRMTRRAEAEGVKAVYYGKNNVFLEGEPGYAEADKLAHYEDLEELVNKHFPGVTVGEMLDITLKHIQGKDEEIRIGRILTNKDAEQWEEWKSLQETGRLVVLPEGYTIEGIAECANQRGFACPPDIGLPSPLHCNHTSCYRCWEAALKGGGQDE